MNNIPPFKPMNPGEDQDDRATYFEYVTRLANSDAVITVILESGGDTKLKVVSDGPRAQIAIKHDSEISESESKGIISVVLGALTDRISRGRAVPEEGAPQ